MTFTIKKLHLAIAMVAVALIAPATAFAVHVFDDVPDGAFYADAVEWAADNGVTLGRTPDLFDPDAGVTRGENVTFAYRYDTNIVQPALADKVDSGDLMWATMDGGGRIIAGSGVNTDPVASKQLNTGMYEVDFLRDDISTCGAFGTPSDLSNSLVANEVTVQYRGTIAPTKLFVTTHASNGTLVDSSFSVFVIC